ncbi:MAG TPA: hypothetical protein VMS18_05810 [Candidatus Binatia bacterium]|nr:hypothetical protein [Candidatus Binatia bacterium]
MPYTTIDVSDEVVAIKRLDVAAVFPNILAFAFAGVALIAFILDSRSWGVWFSMICAAIFLALIGRAIEHGSTWAVMLMTLAVSALSLFAVVGTVIFARDLIARRPDETSKSNLEAAAGLILLLIPTWITVRHGLKAIWHRRRTPLWIKPETRSAWSQLPRDGRWRTALHTFAASLLTGIVGVMVAAPVAFVTGHLLFAALVYLPFARWAGRSWTRGRRELALRVQEVRKLDTRPPVLLLRSFEDDNLILQRNPRLLWFFHAAKEAFTLEEYVVNCIWKLGPVIAVGKPGENLSPLGAAREYVEESQWRDCIRKYLEESACVVSILGSTPGLRWEYEQIGARGKPDNVIVVFPPKPFEQLQRRWGVFRTLFDRAASVDLPFGPKLAAPLLALFRGAGTSPVVLRCCVNDETAYGVAFWKLSECLKTPAGPASV